MPDPPHPRYSMVSRHLPQRHYHRHCYHIYMYTVYTCIFTCMYMYMYTVYTCIFTCTYMYTVYTCIFTCTYMYIVYTCTFTCILYTVYIVFHIHTVCQPLHYCPGWLWRDGSGGNIARGTLSAPYQVREGLTEKPRIEDISVMSSCPDRTPPTEGECCRWG